MNILHVYQDVCMLYFPVFYFLITSMYFIKKRKEKTFQAIAKFLIFFSYLTFAFYYKF